MSDRHLRLVYRNHRGEVAVRRIVPRGILFTTSINHPQQWLLYCHDLDKNAERTYALADCDFRSATAGGALPLTTGERQTLLEALSKLDYGFARELAVKIEATKCEGCRGSGLAPYVGGDDDDVPCVTCDGSGWAK